MATENDAAPNGTIAPEGHTPIGIRTNTGRSRNGFSESWKEQNLLSLDGGGIRGYWTLLILKRLMEDIGDEERSYPEEHLHSFAPLDLPDNVSQCKQSTTHSASTPDQQWYACKYLPCHYFDLICGSSTGSLIAIMLSRLRMTVNDCIDEYKSMGNRIFGNPRPLSRRVVMIGWHKYSASAMEQAFKDVTKRRGKTSSTGEGIVEKHSLFIEEGACAMFATTILKRPQTVSTRTTYLLRSYDQVKPNAARDRNSGEATKMEIWQVARAATAAPFYFRKLRSPEHEGKVYFSDGGFSSNNNPTFLGITEIRLLHGPGCEGAIVSIGTARNDNDDEGMFGMIKQGFSTATDPKTVANFVQSQDLPYYWRLNDDNGISVDMDEWKPNSLFTSEPGAKTLEKIEDGVHKWCFNQRNSDMLKQCARELVKRRRSRIKDQDRWLRYAYGASLFECESRECRRTWDTREEFNAHWNDCHLNEANGDDYRKPKFGKWLYP